MQQQEGKNKYRSIRLGNSGLKVSEASLGAMTFTLPQTNLNGLFANVPITNEEEGLYPTIVYPKSLLKTLSSFQDDGRLCRERRQLHRHCQLLHSGKLREGDWQLDPVEGLRL